MKKILLTLLVILGGTSASFSEPTTNDAITGSDKQPNILFISIDDLNDWVGCLNGYEGTVHTPNIDKLASQGMLFTNAHANAVVCNPSRTSVMTGLLPSTTGIYMNAHHPFEDHIPDVVPLPQQLRENGYTTTCINKVFHGREPKPASWDKFIKVQEKVNVVEGTRVIINRSVRWAELEGPDNKIGDVSSALKAARFLQKEYEKPFFLALGITRPHEPLFAPTRFYDMYPLDEITMPNVLENDLNDVPKLGKNLAAAYSLEPELDDPEMKPRIVQAYLASVSFVDYCVGLAIDGLAKGPNADNTIVVLWSDHGMHLGEKDHWSKMALWEEDTRVPLIITGPGIAPQGAKCDRVVSLIDLYPTLAESCGIPAPASLDGRSLLPLFENPERAWDYPAISTHGKNNHAVRTEGWRYIRYNDGAEELYDRSNDPYEWKNLAKQASSAATKEKLKALLPTLNAEPPANMHRKSGKSQ